MWGIQYEKSIKNLNSYNKKLSKGTRKLEGKKIKSNIKTIHW